jgi:Concanavalin A-like lectin/glucanases superfamily
VNYRVISGNGPLRVNAWSHLVSTYDGSNQRIYLNGTLISARAQSGQIKQSANPLRIGGNAVWGEYFKGTIDEVRLYNCALTATEISADLAKPVGK